MVNLTGCINKVCVREALQGFSVVWWHVGGAWIARSRSDGECSRSWMVFTATVSVSNAMLWFLSLPLLLPSRVVSLCYFVVVCACLNLQSFAFEFLGIIMVLFVNLGGDPKYFRLIWCLAYGLF